MAEDVNLQPPCRSARERTPPKLHSGVEPKWTFRARDLKLELGSVEPTALSLAA